MCDCGHNVEHKKVLCFICQKELYDGCIYCHYDQLKKESLEKCGRLPFAYDFYCDDCRCYTYLVKKEKGLKKPLVVGKLQWKDLTNKKMEGELRKIFPKTKILYGIKWNEKYSDSFAVNKETNDLVIISFYIYDEKEAEYFLSLEEHQEIFGLIDYPFIEGLCYSDIIVGNISDIKLLDEIANMWKDIEKPYQYPYLRFSMNIVKGQSKYYDIDKDGIMDVIKQYIERNK
jgi:hypothetical protein